MKLRIPLVLVAVLLSLTVAYDNPLIPTFMNELVITVGGEWTMEMLFPSGRALDGWGVASHLDTTYFRNGMVAGPGLFVFTKDSLQKPLLFSRVSERILVVTPFGEGRSLAYGSMANSELAAPRFGQSINFDYSGGFYYLDNTPTLGLANDTVHAMGDIAGLVTDTLGVPLKDVDVTRNDGTPFLWVSDSLGRFTIHDYARQERLWFSRTGYNTRQVIAQVYPESTSVLAVRMSVVVSSHEAGTAVPRDVALLASYPNPFNPTTTIRYELPQVMDVRLTVFDLEGRKVADLVDARKEAGFHQTVFDGSLLPSGIYFCRLQAGKSLRAIKLVLLR